MSLAKEMGGLLLDPRGRMSRQDLLVAATLMLTLDMLLAALTTGLALYALKAAAYWIGSVGIIKRLHDTGRSGWWFAGGLAALCIWAAVVGLSVGFTVGVEAMHPGAPGYIVMLSALMLPALGATLWLHFTEGERGMNRFGAEPAGIMAQIAPKPDGEGAASGR
jgi:uncharacterized membrane protein YhaH (DUF805 family)